MKTPILLLILFFIASGLGCMTQRRATKKMVQIKNRYPELFSADTVHRYRTESDTIKVLDSIVIDRATIDTAIVTTLTEVLEDVTVENARLRVALRSTSNIETNTRTWEITGEAKPDTIYQLREKIIKHTHYKIIKPATPCEVTPGAPWWYYALFAIGGAFFTYLGFKKEGILKAAGAFMRA